MHLTSNVEQKSAGIKQYMLYDSIYKKFMNKLGNLLETG